MAEGTVIVDDDINIIKKYIKQKIDELSEGIRYALAGIKNEVDNHTYSIVSNMQDHVTGMINTMFGELYNLKTTVEGNSNYTNNQISYTQGKLTSEHNAIISAIDNIDISLNDTTAAIDRELGQQTDEITTLISDEMSANTELLQDTVTRSATDVSDQVGQSEEIVKAAVVWAQESIIERNERLNSIVVRGIESSESTIVENVSVTEQILSGEISGVQSQLETMPEMFLIGLSFLWEQMQTYLSTNFDLSYEGMVKLIHDRALAEEEAHAQIIKERFT